MPPRPRPTLRPFLAACVAMLLFAPVTSPGAASAVEPAKVAHHAPRLLHADASGALIALDPAAPLAAGWPAALPDLAAEPLTTYAILAAPPTGAITIETTDAAPLSPCPLVPLSPCPLVPLSCPGSARITADAFMRGQRIVTLALTPSDACPNPQVRLSWQGAAMAADPVAPDPFLDAALAGVLLNPAQAAGWRTAPSLSPLSPIPQSPNLESPPERYKISVTRAGLYSVTYAELQAAGAPVATLDPRTFRLTTRGEPVAILVDGEADGRLDPGDTLLFYGEPLTDAPVRDSVILNGALVVTDTVNSRAYSAETDYGDRNVYWLEAGGQPGPRMAAADATPNPAAAEPASFRATVRAEESQWWWTWHFTDREVWFWSRLTTSGVLTTTYPITIAAPDPTGAPAELRAEQVALAYSQSVSPDHRTRTLLNGAPAGDHSWDGPIRFNGAGDVPASALLDGANQISFTMQRQPGTGSDTIYVDWFELTYSRLFRADSDRLAFTSPGPGPHRFKVDGLSGPAVRALDLADPRAPRLLTGLAVAVEGASYSASFTPLGGSGPFLVVGPAGAEQPAQVERRTAPGLGSSGNGADYLVIAPDALLNAARTIADYRAARGMRTAVVELGALIDEFNHGIYHPVAIKRFLAHAYATWPAPAPQYVLLLGDGHWNVANHNPARYGGGPILMPPNLAWVDPFQGQVDSTNQLAAIVGDDIVPDLAIGRLTARNDADVAAYLAKLTAHEGAPADAPWRSSLLFVADNQPDSAGNFAAAMDSVIAATVPGALAASRLYLDNGCGPAQNPPQPCPQLGARLVSTLNLTGTLMLTYGGHGAIDGWAKERVLTNATAAGLTNASAPPFVVSLDCLDGYWSYPGSESLIETMVRMPGGGAAAAFAPTGLGVATGHERLQRGLYASLFAGGFKRIGPASMAAKLALLASGASLDLVDTYTIFGDPAMELALPEAITGPRPPDPPPGPTSRSLFLPLVAGPRP